MTSTLRQVLVHLDPTRGSARRLAIARDIAQRHEASLAALYAAMPHALAVPFAPDISAATIPRLVELDQKSCTDARRAFDAALRGASGLDPQWGESVQPGIVDAVASQALYADLVVLGQYDGDDAAAASVPQDFVSSVVVQSGRPALVVPYIGWDRPIGEVVAIAWKPTREAARAVAAALPFLRRARAVHVFSWGPGEPAMVEGAALNLDSWFDRHGIKARWSRSAEESPEGIGELLLSRTFDVGADLLVMGCYGHSRAREWVLGGASRTLLRSMSLPVLMAH